MACTNVTVWLKHQETETVVRRANKLGRGSNTDPAVSHLNVGWAPASPPAAPPGKALMAEPESTNRSH